MAVWTIFYMREMLLHGSNPNHPVLSDLILHLVVSIVMGGPQNGWLIIETPIKIRVPPF